MCYTARLILAVLSTKDPDVVIRQKPDVKVNILFVENTLKVKVKATFKWDPQPLFKKSYLICIFNEDLFRFSVA